MSTFDIVIPSKPKAVKEEGFSGVYEIDGLYPGYGHTLGNSLRRIILSSLPGAAVTRVKITGAEHEFSTLPGVKRGRHHHSPQFEKAPRQTLDRRAANPHPLRKRLKRPHRKGHRTSRSGRDIESRTAIAELTDKAAALDMEITVEKGLGYVSKDVLHKDRVDIGAIALDASFSPVKRANYEVENMRVGDRTDFNRLRIAIETDGTVTPREALEQSIGTMITQLKSVVGWKEDEPEPEKKAEDEIAEGAEGSKGDAKPSVDVEFLKTRIDDIGLSPRTTKALSNANIRTVGGLARKKEIDILDIDGLGSKGIQEIKKVLAQYGIALK